MHLFLVPLKLIPTSITLVSVTSGYIPVISFYFAWFSNSSFFTQFTLHVSNKLILFKHIRWAVWRYGRSVTIPVILASNLFHWHHILHSIGILHLLAVGSFANVVYNALLTAWQRFIRLVSPENRQTQTLNNTVFWDVTLWKVAEKQQWFGGTHCLLMRLEGRATALELQWVRSQKTVLYGS